MRTEESDTHGDLWFTRIKAEHDRLGEDCPCGNNKPDIECPECGSRMGWSHTVNRYSCSNYGGCEYAPG